MERFAVVYDENRIYELDDTQIFLWKDVPRFKNFKDAKHDLISYHTNAVEDAKHLLSEAKKIKSIS